MKIILMLKRKQGTTPEQFRDHYESSHAPLSARLMPYFKSYKRKYIDHKDEFKPPPPALGGAVEYDVITELEFENRAAFDRMRDALADPKIRGQIIADEEKFMDRTPGGRLMFFVDEYKTPDRDLKAGTG